jgi:hypothetical protein
VAVDVTPGGTLLATLAPSVTFNSNSRVGMFGPATAQAAVGPSAGDVPQNQFIRTFGGAVLENPTGLTSAGGAGDVLVADSQLNRVLWFRVPALGN